MQIIVKYRGQDHRLDLQQSSTLSDLRWQIVEATSVPLANQKLLPKPAKGISLNDDSATLEASGVKDGLTIMLLGASNAEVGKVREEEREATKWSQPRNYHPSMLRGTRPRSTGVGSTSSTNPFLSLAPHRSLSSSHPLHSRVIAYLTRLTQDEGVIHVCHLHNYTIGHLTELLPWENPELLGLNENKGQTIRLRIRTDDAEGFRDYKTTRQVLLHELAHIDVSGHPVEFKELNSKLNAELAAWEKNREEGTHSLVEGEMYAPAPQAGSSNSGGGSYILGGGAAGDLTAGPASSDERRRAILDATLRRIAKVEEEIEAGCGSHQKPHQHQPSQA